MRTAALTVSQQHPSSAARCEMVSPAPTCLTTHLAARVVSMQPFAAMRWSLRVNEPSPQPGSGQISRCFFQRMRHRHPTEGQVDIGDDRAVLDPGPAPALGTRRRVHVLFDGDLAGRPSSRIGQDAHVLQADEMGDDLVRIDVHRGVEDLLLSHKRETEAPLCLRGGSPLMPRSLPVRGSTPR